MPQPKTLPLILVEEGGLKAAGLSKSQLIWAAGVGFSGQRGKLAPLPAEGGGMLSLIHI